MSYNLGIDLGTTFTAAAIDRSGRVEMATLGDRSTAIPSVVLIRQDGTVLTGDAAVRRAASEPSRVAREFKRRLGDPTPLVLGGAPHSVASVLAALLTAVVSHVAEREGGPADQLTLTHPANWGPYKKELFSSVPHLADVARTTMITEPEAAAAHYATNERLDAGATVAVYDFGGGTFDATVLRKTETGFDILGTPEGVEGLGGIDFDEAVFAHVNRSVNGAISELDPAEPRHATALLRLRAECVLAKEALSADTEALIPVLLPNLQTEVRLTRAELEEMMRPSIAATVSSLRRALTSANVTPEDLTAVLLVGGSSRIPLVSQMVSAELGRPTAIDTHPKHSIALGAAFLATKSANTPPAQPTEATELLVPTQPAESESGPTIPTESTIPVAAPRPTPSATSTPLPGPAAIEQPATTPDQPTHRPRHRRSLIASAAVLVAAAIAAALLHHFGGTTPTDPGRVLTPPPAPAATSTPIAPPPTPAYPTATAHRAAPTSTPIRTPQKYPSTRVTPAPQESSSSNTDDANNKISNSATDSSNSTNQNHKNSKHSGNSDSSDQNNSSPANN
jgi:molecular chaperone DnaK (HSP70)